MFKKDRATSAMCLNNNKSTKIETFEIDIYFFVNTELPFERNLNGFDSCKVSEIEIERNWHRIRKKNRFAFSSSLLSLFKYLIQYFIFIKL